MVDIPTDGANVVTLSVTVILRVSLDTSVLANVNVTFNVAIIYFFNNFFSTVPSSYIKNSN